MKTFINAARIAVVMLLFVSLTALGNGCCATKCAPKCAPKRTCAVGCRLQPEPVKIRKTCDNPGYYKQVCHLEYEPCEGKVEEITAMPIFKGCYDEQGNKLDGNGSSYARSSDQAAFTQDVDIQVTVPSSYTQTGTSSSHLAMALE